MEPKPDAPNPDESIGPDQKKWESEAGQELGKLAVPSLGWVFLKIGATAFGGLGAGLAIIERELVDRRQVLTAADVTEALTYTKLLPGSTVVQVVSYLGYKLGGWPGSAIATVAFVLPSAAMMILLAAGYIAATVVPNLGPAINGLTAAVIGLLLATTYRLGKSNIQNPLTGAIAVCAFLAAILFGINAAFIVIAAGLIGILFLSPSSGSTEKARRAER
ncbi:MAG TPA: chromate transporter [Dehalococcoidia bacterium]|nr:chromate transporter [Dehalococcoidia bacterium]